MDHGGALPRGAQQPWALICNPFRVKEQNMTKKGTFITIEGIEGAGKSTAIKFMQEYLSAKNKGVDVIVTREPGGTEIAEKIRQILLDHHEEKMAEDTELLLMFASRAQHLARVIRPALASGMIVLCDRFTDASFAYQGGGRGIPVETIAVLEKWVHADLQPDFTILLDLPVEIGMRRAKGRSNLDRFESEEFHFFEKVRECYLQRAKKYAARYRIVNSSVIPRKMKEAIAEILDEVVS
jgi:dTMP kinase